MLLSGDLQELAVASRGWLPAQENADFPQQAYPTVLDDREPLDAAALESRPAIPKTTGCHPNGHSGAISARVRLRDPGKAL